MTHTCTKAHNIGFPYGKWQRDGRIHLKFPRLCKSLLFMHLNEQCILLSSNLYVRHCVEAVKLPFENCKFIKNAHCKQQWPKAKIQGKPTSYVCVNVL